MGAGFALGASSVRPGRELWIVYGDGACGCSLAEIDSLVRQGFAVIMVVGNEAGWTQIAREQVKMLKDDVGAVLSRTDQHRAAEGRRRGSVRAARRPGAAGIARGTRALAAAGRPVRVDVWLDETEFREGSLSP